MPGRLRLELHGRRVGDLQDVAVDHASRRTERTGRPHRARRAVLRARRSDEDTVDGDRTVESKVSSRTIGHRLAGR